jgi:hypothetical protein
MAEADFAIIWRGVIDNVKYQKNTMQISCIDLLYLSTDANYPPAIGDDNTVQDNPMSDSQNYVTLGSVAKMRQFATATANQPRTIKIGSEYITYTGQDEGNLKLTGLTRGRMGSSAAAHNQGVAIKQALSYGSGASTGIAMDLILLDLICNLGNIPGQYMANSATATTLDGGINASATSIVLDSVTGFPTAGIIKIGTELIAYTGISTLTLTGCTRGRFNTTAAAHDDEAAVYLTQVSYEKNRWHSGHLYYYICLENKKVSDILQKIQLATLCDVFMNEDGDIDFSIQAPPVAGESIKTITLEDIKDGQYDIDLNEDSRLSRVFVYHSPKTVDCDEKPANFGWYLYFDYSAEQAYSYGDKKKKAFYCQFINRQSTEAEWLGSRLYYRYKLARPKVKLTVELKDSDIGVGDLIKLELPELVNENGSLKTSGYFRVMSKAKKRFSAFEFELQDAGFGASKYAVIGKINQLLKTAIDADDTTIELTFGAAANDKVFADWNTAGAIWILDPTNGNEKITFTGITDNTTYVSLTGCTRHVEGATAAHDVGCSTIQCYTAQSATYKAAYSSIGSAGAYPTGNLLDATDEGFYIS